MRKRRSRRQHFRLRILATFVVAGLSGGLVSCGTPAKPTAARAVVLISLDTFRWDGLSALTGEQPPLTPRLDELAEDGVLFRGAMAHMSHTLPSHMSLMTGLYPWVHRVRRENDRLTASVPTLAELLSKAGFNTAAVVSAHWLKREFGFGRGFDQYDRVRGQLQVAKADGATFAEQITEAAAAHLEAEPAEGLLFSFLHYFDAHSDMAHSTSFPYYCPPSYRVAGLSDDGSEFCDSEGNCATDYLLAANSKQRTVDAGELALLFELYRCQIRHLDDQLGLLLDRLQEVGLYDHSLIVVTADHGEEFREHGTFLHSQTYHETIAVPLLIKFPGGWQAGRVVEHVVETVDVLPTILDYLALTIPSHVQGRSLLPLVRGEGRGKQIGLSRDKLNDSRFSIATRRLKLLYDFDDGSLQLFDKLHDPQELHDVSASRSEEVERLQQALISLIERGEVLASRLEKGEVLEASNLSEEERAQLRALGYLN